MKTFSLKLPEDIHRQIKIDAIERSVTMNFLIIEALKNHLKEVKK